MLDLILIIILLMGFLIGLKRGFILQIVHLTGFIVAFIVAYVYSGDLAPAIKLWVPYVTLGDNETITFLFESTNLEAAYYRAIAFAMLFFGTKVILQIVGSMLDFLAHLPILKQINGWAGGMLGFIEIYLLVFIVLYIGALMPIETVQGYIQESFMAKTIVQNTPIFSGKIKDLWIEHIAM
ncbi:CvpA family protein [Bacillus luteolus]|uniref:CvpA family protein n=1 Tax=Litchfieldia luteola TaxID=682179 RepID=A0ABR9QI84_9BACI|nr:CvpA family protein [Cytobacillus luteolus]MBE4908209.1 CvpA family protein [Cytobacillus luteolus]MBP1942995.1 putative membrane protein required for colicin V production [Cytobacillus luteolus]